ncbi:hypothetical protein BC941DRAFT_408637 [Chlamydoabsidia padenii]|nr:hypothetical protein BC941DRAFT_408637 [Chlamydoabsidia padenii]
MRHRRLHSNTISGDRLPNIDTTIRPSLLRRNSEGSPGLPPEIDISTATPLDPKDAKQQEQYLSLDHFPSTSKHKISSSQDLAIGDKENDGIYKASSSPSLPTPVVAPEVSSSNNHTLRIPNQAKKLRSRSSSQSTTGSTSKTKSGNDGTWSRKVSESEGNNNNNNGAPNSINLKVPSSRRGSNGTEDWNSEGEQSMVAGSIAIAVRAETVSDKRNQDFHALFRSVPEDDMLIEDYGCALQKEILVQGRIYISENHLCFNANIFGWVTNLVIAFADIVDIEKRTTAIFIPNAIQVSTLHAKHFFASFLSRDQAFDLMVDVWRYSRPIANKTTDSNIDDSTNSQHEENGELADELEEEDTSDMDSDYTYSGTETEDEDNHTSLPTSSLPPSVIKNVSKNDSLRRRALSEGAKHIDNMVTDNMASTSSLSPSNAGNANDNHKSPQPTPLIQASSSPPPPMPQSQPQSTQMKQAKEKTDCQCGLNGQHYPNTVMDRVYKGSLESMNKLLFTGGFMKKFLTEDEKSTEVEIGEWSISEETKKQVRKASYIKQLNGSIGPKQTQCLQTEEVIHSDMAESMTVLTTTQTPDVPYGATFSVKTRTCMTWAGYGKVRILVTVLVDFTKSSWLKSTIEKASIDGQVTFYKHLDTVIQQYIKQHPSEFSLGGPEERKKKGKRRHRKHKKEHSNTNQHDESTISSNDNSSGHWVDMVMESLKHVWNLCPFGDGSMFTNSYLTIVCLLLMVFANVYIAYKMKNVENRLNSMVPSSPHQQQTHYYGGNIRDYDALERMYRDELWDWLKALDSNQEDYVTNATAPPDKTRDSSLMGRQETNSMIDQNLLELVKMVRRAEWNIGQASMAMERQREKIENNLLSPTNTPQ